MKIIEVNNDLTKKEFLLLPVRLYKNEKIWIRPLDKDIESVFDPKKNKLFRHGEAARFLLQSDEGETVGRVAVFVDKKTSNKNDQPTGGMGFFECIDNKDAAFMLFAKCQSWLAERGQEAMDGPINFGDRDRWWGLLIEGFTEPNYCMPYNFTYYQKFFEDFGFKLYFKQYTYARRVVDGGLIDRVKEKAERIGKNPDYTFRHIEKNKLEKYAEDFRTIYNLAWVKHAGVSGMSKQQAMSIMNQLKPILDEKIIWFSYYKDEPVAFFINLPEINQIIKHLNGKLDLLGKIKFMYHKLTGTCKKMFGVAFGVVPEHQGKGLEGAIVIATTSYIWSKKSPYRDFEMNWIGDFNPKMMRVAEEVGGKIHKTHYTYRKLFDESKEFIRAPNIH
ncbi:MAG: hypothetical protein M3512_15390 [Bacteroidota bacterium]|nr:hypothetical protein [Bacteroidota bacterium]